MKKRSALELARYARFRNDADRALEKLLRTTQLKITDITGRVFQDWLEKVSFMVMHARGRLDLHQLSKDLEQASQGAATDIAWQIISLKRRSFNLSLAAESEAMAQITGHAVSKSAQHNSTTSFFGGDIDHRIEYAFAKLNRRILDAVHLGAVKGDSKEAIVARVARALPATRRLPDNPHVLYKMLEAENPDDLEDKVGAADTFSDDEWTDIVDAYKEEYVPEWRDPTSRFGGRRFVNEEGDRVYAWEIEQEVTENFVRSVRDGQKESFKQNGVEDFVWIAVLDAKTDECCQWRDGLTSAQIEKSLADGMDDDCDAIMPPAHVNCRCRPAPMLAFNEDELPSNIEEFSDWLNQKAA